MKDFWFDVNMDGEVNEEDLILTDMVYENACEEEYDAAEDDDDL